jgi:hypothetical protein
MLIKEAPELIFTGLKAPIGKPRDLDRNLENEAYFQNVGIDLTIPLEETNEYPKKDVK